MAESNKPKLVEEADDQLISVEKPKESVFERFKSKRAPSAESVGTLPSVLTILKIADAKDFVRLHHDEENYWSPETCFVNVPIEGMKRDQLHLIDEDPALANLAPGRILRFRLALATKPYDKLFLCQIPTTNLDNKWNAENLQACEAAKTSWVSATSRGSEGSEGYKVDFTKDKDAFPDPKWPKTTLSDIVEATFEGRMITDHDHPALRRLVGRKQTLK
jgi:hypothetical protein